jgi:hypothetical protein
MLNMTKSTFYLLLLFGFLNVQNTHAQSTPKITIGGLTGGTVSGNFFTLNDSLEHSPDLSIISAQFEVYGNGDIKGPFKFYGKFNPILYQIVAASRPGEKIEFKIKCRSKSTGVTHVIFMRYTFE